MLNLKETFVISIYIALTYGLKDTCFLPGNKRGVCVDLRQCAELQQRQLQGKISLDRFKLMNKAQCRSSNICCPSKHGIWENSKRTRKSVPISKDEDVKCGIQYSTNRIFGGTMTDLHEFPWMTLLIYQTEKGPGLACGGVLISRKYVLTAAHCVTGTSVRKIGNLIAVRLGEYNIDTPVDCDNDEIDEDCALPHLDIFIESSIPHPNYTAGSSGRYNDIALIKLKQAVNYTKDVQPICLARTSQMPNWNNPGTNLYICGWGQTETRETGSSIKLKAQVPVVRDNICAKSYARSGIVLSNTQICAGGGNEDSCKGDSGGPLMFEDNSDPTEIQWYAVAVISFGAQPCATIGVPAVYTKLTPYLDWIYTTISS
ncbi:hypothetical protein RI129_000826 [Pyrocoelia pectoralis]|uniref:CLIP domain-containing serine protease n=1 Tax=Pyrocoelia pectoralis TaxID=417401 RepID=A0AAN7VJQ0_9COLE